MTIFTTAIWDDDNDGLRVEVFTSAREALKFAARWAQDAIGEGWEPVITKLNDNGPVIFECLLEMSEGDWDGICVIKVEAKTV